MNVKDIFLLIDLSWIKVNKILRREGESVDKLLYCMLKSESSEFAHISKCKWGIKNVSRAFGFSTQED